MTTREYNQRNLKFTGEQLFSGSLLARNIKAIVEPYTTDGETMTLEMIVNDLKLTTVLRHPDRLAILVGDCVREGSVPGFAIKKGKVGGVFHINSYIDKHGLEAFEALAVSREVEGLEFASDARKAATKKKRAARKAKIAARQASAA